MAQQPGAPPGQSKTGQPDAFDIMGKPYVVVGYRSAKWGMTPAETRAAIAIDFPAAKISDDVRDPLNRTTVVSAALDRLSPGPGPAVVSYVFGATSGRLMHVNVDWTIGAPTVNYRVALTVAGSRLVADFAGYFWKLLTVARGMPVGPNELILFAGTGEAGGAVEVRLIGVGYTVQTAAGVLDSAPPKGSAALHMAFAQTDANPDAYMIKPGEF
jgi:hypothetical protein